MKKILKHLIACSFLLILLTACGVTLEETTNQSTLQDTSISTELTLQSEEGVKYWGNPRSLTDHYERHGSDVEAVSEEDYANKAHEFYLNRNHFQQKIDEKKIIRVFDENTQMFGAYNKDGTTKTFFKPSAGQKYFDRQPGKLIEN